MFQYVSLRKNKKKGRKKQKRKEGRKKENGRKKERKKRERERKEESGFWGTISVIYTKYFMHLPLLEKVTFSSQTHTSLLEELQNKGGEGGVEGLSPKVLEHRPTQNALQLALVRVRKTDCLKMDWCNLYPFLDMYSYYFVFTPKCINIWGQSLTSDS